MASCNHLPVTKGMARTPGRVKILVVLEEFMGLQHFLYDSGGLKMVLRVCGEKPDGVTFLGEREEAAEYCHVP